MRVFRCWAEWRTRPERIYREMKVNMIGGGIEEIMKDPVARQLGYQAGHRHSSWNTSSMHRNRQALGDAALRRTVY